MVPHVKRTPGIGGVNFGRREMSVVLMGMTSWSSPSSSFVRRRDVDVTWSDRRKFHIGEDPIEIIDREKRGTAQNLSQLTTTSS